MQRHRYDAVVLGGGLIGSATALALARHGFSVGLVDAAPVELRADPAFDGRAYAVAPGSRNLLAALGVWDAVAGDAQPVRHISVADACPGPVAPASLHFDPAETAQPALGWIVEDRWLRQALLAAVTDAGVDHLAPVEVGRVERETARATVALSDGRSLSASLIVACDGRQSATARAAGIQYLAWGYGQTGLVSALEHTLPHEGQAHQAFFPGGPFAVLPLTGNRSSLVWSEQTARAEQIAALDDAAYLGEVAARLDGRLGDIRLVGRRWAYPLGLSLAMRYAAPRLVVAGDAAHGVHPIAGQGMNMGLRDVAALTEVLVEGARLGLDPGDQSVLERYQQWRRFDATAMALGMDGINRVFSQSGGAVQAVRNLGLKAVAGLGDLRRAFMAEAAGQSGDVPGLLQGRAL